MQILTIPASFFTKSQAIELAAELNADSDDGWTYTPVHPPTNTRWSKIAIYDEENVFVAYL